jgi:WD40 repeat protein
VARVGTMRLRQGSQINSLAFSPDGGLIASGSFYGDLCIWDRATGKLVRRLVHPSKIDSRSWATSIAFSPDGKNLASNKHGRASLWDVRSGQHLRDLETSSSGRVCSLAFAPDGKLLAFAGEKGIWLYDLCTENCWPIPGPTGPMTAVAFSRDGKNLVSGGVDKIARIWDINSERELWRIGLPEAVVDVALSYDGKMLAAQTKKEIFLWEVVSRREFRRFQAERHLRSLVFSPDGTKLASANVVWNVTTGKEVCQLEGLPSTGLAWGPDGKTMVPISGGIGPIITGTLAFASDGRVLATGGYDGVIRLHDPLSGKELPLANKSLWNRGELAVCGFSPDGRWLAVRDNGGIHLCETSNGKEIHRLAMGDDHGVSPVFPLPVAVAPDGRMVVAAGTKAIYRWDTTTGQELGRIANPIRNEDLGPVATLTISADGRTFACACYEATIRLWDAASGKELGHFEGHEGPVYRLFFTPDSQGLVSMSNDSTFRLWDKTTGDEIRRQELQSEWVQAVSPDGKTVVVTETGTDRMTHLRDLANGTELRRIEIRDDHRGAQPATSVNSCTFSPDGRLLAVDADPNYYSGRERTIHLLEVASGKVRGQFAGHFGFPGQMVFSPDGRMLATGSSDTTALIWDVTGRMQDGRLQREQLSGEGLKTLWSDLAAENAPTAHRAVWTLVAAPEQALSLLKEKLPPNRADVAPRIKRLIEDLDSNQFAVRNKAAGELEELGDRAEPALRKILEGDPPLEVSRRIERILAKMDVSAKRLQTLRAVEVLEHIATPEAGELLRALAQGDPEAPLTQESKASWQRLAKRPGATP